MKRQIIYASTLLVILYFLAGCAPAPIVPLYTDDNIVINKAKWANTTINSWQENVQSRRRKAISNNQNPDKAEEIMRRIDTTIVLMIDEIEEGEHYFLRIGFEIHRTLQILGPGALIMVMQDADSNEVRIPDQGLIFSGKRPYTWDADTANGPVIVDRHYSLYRSKSGKASPQQCIARVPRHATRLKLLRIELNPEQFSPVRSVASTSN